MRKLLLVSFLSAFAVPACAQGEDALPPASSPAPGSYDYGMQQRRKGDHAGAKDTFMRLLLQNTSGAGALEGLALSCMALGQYEEAGIYLGQWDSLSPENPYILRLLLRVQTALRDEPGALRTCARLAALDPRDCGMRSRLDALSERLEGGVFPRARAYRSYSIEGLDTASPQTIIYEGRSAGARFRFPLKEDLDLIGGAEIREEAQRNDGSGLTYYDIEEQAYSAGLGGRPSRNFRWEAEYGRSVLSDIEGFGVGYKQRDRARLFGDWRWRGADLRLTLATAPRFLRVSGGAAYFQLLRENSARAEAEGGRWGWNWLGRAGVTATSDGTGLAAYSLRGSRERGPYVFQSAYSHGQQEFYSGSAAGRLRYVNTDRLSLGLRRFEPEVYRAGVSAAKTFYSDANRLDELDAELTAWLPWQKEFYGGYRFSLREFGGSRSGYDSVDERGHWLGAYWQRCRGHNWSALAGYERGFLRDTIISYDAEVFLAEAEWYSGRSGSVRLQGKRRTTTGRGHSYSAGLQARYTFK